MIDGPVDAWNNACKRLWRDEPFVYILSRQVVSEIGRKDESILGNIPSNKVECIRCLVLLNGAGDVAVPEQVLVRRQRRLREQRTSRVEILIIILGRKLSVNSVGARLGKNLDTVVARRIVLRRVWI